MGIVIDAGFIATVSITAALFVYGTIRITIALVRMAREAYSFEDETNFEID